MITKSYTVTITEALKLFTDSRTAVTWWVQRGYIEAIKVKGKWMLNEESLQEFKKRWDAGFPGEEIEYYKNQALKIWERYIERLSFEEEMKKEERLVSSHSRVNEEEDKEKYLFEIDEELEMKQVERCGHCGIQDKEDKEIFLWEVDEDLFLCEECCEKYEEELDREVEEYVKKCNRKFEEFVGKFYSSEEEMREDFFVSNFEIMDINEDEIWIVNYNTMEDEYHKLIRENGNITIE